MLLKNKKGFIFTAGLFIVSIIALLIVVGGLMVFISMNKFAIIGGGLIAITLIFGLRGDFNKQKAIFMVIIISLGLFFILGSNMLQTQFSTPSHIFIDKELGMITTGIGGILTEQAYFKSTTGAGITVSNVGEKVKICDTFATVPNYKYSSFEWITKRNSIIIATSDMASYANKGGTYCRSWTPQIAGNYEVVSTFLMCPDIIGPVRPEDCLARSSDDTKQYFLEVKAADQLCNLKPYTGDWYIAENIPNGKVLKAKVFKVTNDCGYAINYELVQTQCDDNYLIEGSNLKSTSNDGWNCVSATSGIDEDNSGIDDAYEQRDEECNIDLIVECGDGTEIIDKLCVEGLYFDAGAKCSSIGDNDLDDDGILDDQDEDDDNDGTLDEDDKDDKNFMSKYGVWIIGGVFAMILFVIIFFRRRK